MSEYNDLLTEVKTIAAKYSMANMLKGFTPSLLNILLQNNIEKLKEAENYNTTLLLINDAIKSKFSAGAVLDDFITSEGDRERLYELFAQWRGKLLAELAIQN